MSEETTKTAETLAAQFADEFEAFVTTDDEYGDQEFGQFCQKHHAKILAGLRALAAQAGETYEDYVRAEYSSASNAYMRDGSCRDPNTVYQWKPPLTLEEWSGLRTPAPASQTLREVVEQMLQVWDRASKTEQYEENRRINRIKAEAATEILRCPASPSDAP